jgi:hypothetical protein
LDFNLAGAQKITRLRVVLTFMGPQDIVAVARTAEDFHDDVLQNRSTSLFESYGSRRVDGENPVAFDLARE